MPEPSVSNDQQARAADGQLFESAFRHAGVGLALIDLDGRFTQVNDALCRMVGYSRDELRALDLETLTHPEDRAVGFELAKRARGGELDSHELKTRFLCKDGTSVWAALTLSVVRTNDGSAPFFIAQCRDLSGKLEHESEQHWLASLVESSADAVIGLDLEGRVRSWNAGAEAVYGYSAAEMLGRTNEILLPTGQADEVLRVLQSVPSDVSQYKFDTQRRRKDGVLVDVNLSAARVHDENGRAIGWALIGRDASEAKRLRRVLVRQVEIYTAIARSLPLGSVSMFDRDFRYVAAEGPELFALLQVSSHGIVGTQVGEAASPENRDALLTLCRAALAGNVVELEFPVGARTLLLRAAPVTDQEQAIVAGVILALDVTNRVLQEDELKRTKALLEATFSNIADGVALLDDRRRILLANDAYRRLLALPPERLGELTLDQLTTHLREFAYDPKAVSEALAAGEDQQRTSEFLLKAPVRRWLRRTLTPIDNGGEHFFLAVWRDITAERDQISAREREVFTDVLTGVPNRRAGEEALAAAARRAEKFCVAMFDIDHFKQVNDTCGHAVGDDVLKRVASALASQARSKDIVARWGGEEFIAVLETDLAGARIFCERARACVSELTCPEAGHVTVSAGVVEHEPAQDIAHSVERADRALYQAKEAGRNRLVSA
ncbi:MAG TPA: PAS domain S-box protein [Polyangiaceae bacterium]